MYLSTANFSAITFLLIGFILCICVICSSLYAYVSYRNYRQSRMMYSEQIAKLKIKDPIIASTNLADNPKSLTVIKVVENQKPMISMANKAKNNPEHRAKFKFWSRNKQQELKNQRRFNYGKVPISKEMTI
ncbi:hypothetical protein BLA29_002859 [Euroglyphus maynei]|uniref:Uncharacterized protein n=1 Tax=Euroglyphus maynei TaxID=6958 RepID=A0A1Y3B043_EURMA|nr:hypothetical protein BLA29_002859 [Euroglyphus maynei]